MGMLRVVAAVAILIGLAGCSDDTPKVPAHWKVVGQTRPPGNRIVFVEMDPKFAKNRGDYDSAVAALCDGQTMNVGFFLPGDRVPQSSITRDFFGAGGWSNYSPIALAGCQAAGDRFTKWDCDRAGTEGAPEGALCGEGVKEAYAAILSLGSEIGTGAACGWKPAHPENVTIAKTYLDGLPDLQRKVSWHNTFDLFSRPTGPDDRRDCQRLRKQIQTDAAAARKLLSKPVKQAPAG